MIQTITYPTRKAKEIGNIREARRGFASVNVDFINNNESNGFIVKYDNTIIPTIPKRRLSESAFIRELAQNSDIELI